MPRVTYEMYRQRHLQLRTLWQEQEGLFVLVDPKDQWALHEYYLCADQPTESELQAHYEKLKRDGSSLPNRAGKAYAELARRLQTGRPVQSSSKGTDAREGKVLMTRPLVQPHINLDLYIATAMQIVDRLAVDDPDRLRIMVHSQKLDR